MQLVRQRGLSVQEIQHIAVMVIDDAAGPHFVQAKHGPRTHVNFTVDSGKSAPLLAINLPTGALGRT
jgi:hypothetical protein